MQQFEKIKKFLGPGPYPIEPGSPEFLDRIGFYSSDNVAVLRPRVPIIDQDPTHSHLHDSYEFTIAFSGNPFLRHGKKVIRLEAERLLPCNPAQYHGPAERISKADFLVVQIQMEFLRNLTRAVYRRNDLVFKERPFVPSADLVSSIEGFIAECSGGADGKEIYLDTLEVQIALMILRQAEHNMQKKPRPGSVHSGRNIMRAIEMMKAHFEEDFSSARLAESARMSRYHFFRAFKEQTGKTPYCFLTDIRVEKAAAMLADKNRTITEISYKCGFSSHSHFTCIFRKKKGMTPSEYRNACIG